MKATATMALTAPSPHREMVADIDLLRQVEQFMAQCLMELGV